MRNAQFAEWILSLVTSPDRAAATVGDLTGDEAALELLSWKDGHFRILPLKKAPPATVTASTDSLLLQTCLLQDHATGKPEPAAANAPS